MPIAYVIGKSIEKVFGTPEDDDQIIFSTKKLDQVELITVVSIIFVDSVLAKKLLLHNKFSVLH